MDPLGALREIAFRLERALESTYRVQAFRTAAAVVARTEPAELAERHRQKTLTELSGIGDRTATVIGQALDGRTPAYLEDLRGKASPLPELDDDGAQLLARLRGDLHSHSDWSDGGSPIDEMARTAAEMGHEYLALTDHSPRLTVANGLSPSRLRRQFEVVDEVGAQLAPFRLLKGIEVDILDSGALDQEPELLEALDVVVASVHSKLRMESAAMTRRMVAAIANPHTDVLGHCTGRYVTKNTRTGKPRPPSDFDAEIVFAACQQFDVAVEINSRPERLDPPRELLRLAVEAGCLFSIDTDAHAPGQLDWRAYGVERAVACGVPADRIVTTWPLDRLLEWTRRAR
ncbi:PHP domain-containing protein [Angustibacter luteus]|uniref:PHP domain-containing protein n=1 Tax=Angustibacter luteus TaxID=658456 RepID=A0ABW1J9L9_9ACTN